MANIVQQSNAQIEFIEHPSGYLSEDKVQQILFNVKKQGIDDNEYATFNNMLHKKLKLQEQAITNGGFAQKTILPPQVFNTGCANSSFETGTTNGWSFIQASNSGLSQSNPNSLPCPTCFNPADNATTYAGAASGGVYQITSLTGSAATCTVNTSTANTANGDVSATCICSTSTDCGTNFSAGIDAFGGFPVVAPAPFGGSYSLLLNNSNCGHLMQRASYSFVVDTSNFAFTFQYALVLQSSAHPQSLAPYFQVSIIDNILNDTVPSTSYYVTAVTGSPSLATFSVSAKDNSVYYKPWQTITQNLSSVMGHSVTVNFDISDCSAGGHFGYAYIDASCVLPQITASNALCSGGSTVLSAPSGMSTYTWTGPVAGNSQNLSTGTPGSYTLTGTSVTGATTPTLYYNLTQITSTSPIVSIIASQDSVCSGTPIILTASGANTYTWSNSVISNSISVSPTNSITYTVTGIDTVKGCINNPDTATQMIYIKSCTTGLNNDATSNEQVNIYPNPNNGSFVIEPNSAIKQTMQVYDINGKLVLSQRINGKTTIDASSLNEGVYNINLQSNEGVVNKRLVIVR